MKKNYFSGSLMFLFCFIFSSISFSQNVSRGFSGARSISENSAAKSQNFKHIPKKQGTYSAQDWQVVIDSTWGQGDHTVVKLRDFDAFCKRIDEKYPSFYNLNVNWDSLRNVFRPEIEAGVSRGRFYAIMSQLFISLKDNHTRMVDKDVAGTELKHGVPLLVPDGYWGVGHFGAALAPLPDSSLFVYRAVGNHPLGLEVGDIVLGYDGTPWKTLYKELLEIQFPIAAYIGNGYKELRYWSSTETGIGHTWLTSAGMNWHLFDTLDVVKYHTGETVHLSVKPLEAQNMELVAAGQLPVPGVPFPQIQNDYNPVSWGIIENTKIGYLYVYSWVEGVWTKSPGSEFTEAIEAFMSDENIEGLIIDSRLNEGGSLSSFTRGLGMLFNDDWDLTQYDIRADRNDHFAMQWQRNVEFEFDGSNFFDKPIAVLTGPLSQSAGDMFPFIFESHPMSHSFGLPTSGAFGSFEWTERGHWQKWITVSNWRYRNQAGVYFTHKVFPPDETLWLEREDAVKGEDTVVKRAMEWITNLSYAHDVQVNKTYLKPNLDTLNITAEVENPNQHNLSVLAYIMNDDSTMVDSCNFYNDGKHNDGAAGDSLWGCSFRKIAEEQTYHISVKTNDPDADSPHKLPNAAHFTSIGPVVLEDYIFMNPDTLVNPGETIVLQLKLKNESTITTVRNITVELECLETVVSNIFDSNPTYGDMAPGETSTTSGAYYVKLTEDCPANMEIHFRVAISSNGYVLWSDTFFVHIYPTGVTESQNNIPAEFALYQNYPNPFNPATTINYELTGSSNVKLSIYDITSREIKMLVNEKQIAGKHSVSFDASNLASGIYIYKLKTDSFEQSRKMILLR